MRKILIAMAIVPLALSACSSEPAEPPADEASAEPAAPGSSANGSPPGTYQVAAPDGTVSMTTLNADGTYTDFDAEGAVIAEGTFAVVDGKSCFTPTTEGVTPMCYEESTPGPDGAFTATGDDGTSVMVSPALAPAPAPAE
jgi:hypothetical protein